MVVASLREALDAVEPRPAPTGLQADKKNYAERLSRRLAVLIANGLRPSLPGVIPDADGRGHESPAMSARGVKKLDVNYSTPQLGLGLGISVKTLNFRDPGTKRYTKNYSRIDNELRAEAHDYHRRQPYSVLVAIVFLPADSCDDGVRDVSSFAAAVNYFRRRNARVKPQDDSDLFERVFVAIYEHDGPRRGEVRCFDVVKEVPKQGRPDLNAGMDLNDFFRETIDTFRKRNAAYL